MVEIVLSSCPECQVEPDSLHIEGCANECCPNCGGQLISCNCIYELCGINPELLETQYPDLFKNGPSEAMYEKWDIVWQDKRIPWSGEYSGRAECREFGWYVKFVNGIYIRCNKDDTEAIEDIDRVYSKVETNWDIVNQRWVLKPDKTDEQITPNLTYLSDEEIEENRTAALTEALQNDNIELAKLVENSRDKFILHEAMHMAYMIFSNIDDFLLGHPAVLIDPLAYKLADNAHTALFNLYKYIGNLRFADETPEKIPEGNSTDLAADTTADS